MRRHRAVFFDLGGTLFSYRSIDGHFDGVLAKLARGRGVERPLPDLRQVYRGAMGRVMLDWASRPYYLHRDLFTAAHLLFLQNLGVTASADDPDLRLSERSVLSEPEIEPRDDAAATLAVLRERGLHLQVVSNIDDDQLDAVWPKLGLEAHVDAITTSEEARSCKPDPGIFRIALEKAGNPDPASVVFVGDSVLHDVAGAKALGMTSVLIGEPPKPAPAHLVPDHVIATLSELLAIAER